LKNAKKTKYEMGNFCEQFELPLIVPFRKNRKKSDKFSKKKPTPYYNTFKKRKFNKPSTSNNFSKKFKKPKKKRESKFEKYFSKDKCFNCGETGKIGRSLINFPERNLLHITILTRKENLINFNYK
jgi:hypothetical protein